MKPNERYPQDINAAVARWKKGAAEGDPEAQNNLGVAYYSGKGVERDIDKATDLWLQAAKQGDADAAANLGRILDLADKCEEAVAFYRMAADKGHSRAQNNLGVMYATGRGVRQSYATARDWYLKAAKHGDVYAQFSLGMMCATGEGGPLDEREAERWWSEAARQGHPDAKSNLEKLRRRDR